MIKLIYSHSNPRLMVTLDDTVLKEIQASCVTRNELNGLRKSHEIVRSIPHQVPVMPRPFPVGKWIVGEPRARTQPDRKPFFIPTNATRQLPVWSIKNGRYEAETTEMTVSSDYGLHCSVYKTSLGCIVIAHEEDVVWLVDLINREHKKGNTVELHVL